MGIRDKPIVLGSPWQNLLCRAADRNNPRECVDHVIALGEQHLHQVLKSYANYYNTLRTHRSLDKDAPVSRPVQRIGRIVRMPWPAAYITDMFESEFPAHTAAHRLNCRYKYGD